MNDRPPLFARIGLAVIVLLIVSFVAWSSIARIEEIARGEGKVIPVSRTQIIQASEPGVVQEITVQPGQVVNRGDLIIRLDDTLTTSSLGEAEARRRALRAQIARLAIEESGDIESAFVCPDDLLAGAPQICNNEARLLLAKPKIVFLDEPSGAMDLATEKGLIQNLARAFDRSTTLIISTHRYSMLELVDRLIVIEQGRVVADGPKKTVIEGLQQKAVQSG